jgi:hypothetical protein
MSRTITQTQTQTQTRAPRTVTFNYTLHQGDPGDDGDGDDGSPSSGNSGTPNELFPCDKIVNVYASIPILYKMKGSYIAPNGRKYHVITPKTNVYSAIQETLDPEEFRIYEPLMFLEQNKLLIPYRKDKKVPLKGQEWLFVRCKNNSLHIVSPSDLVNNVLARERYQYRKAPIAKKIELNEKNHFVFERETKNTNRKIKALMECNQLNTSECKDVLQSSCDDETKDPGILKTVYDLGYRTSKNPGRTWEEVCYDTSHAKPVKNTSRSSVGKGGSKKKK